MKNIISNNFSKASNSYDKVAIVQKKAANDLIDLFVQNYNFNNINNILDIGCGTGFLEEIILNKINKNYNFVLNDISKSMIDIVKRKFSTLNARYILGDIENNVIQNQVFNNAYDLIISSFSLQWIEDFKSLISFISKYTRYLAFTTLYEGNFEKINSIISPSPIKKYCSYDNLCNIVNDIYPNSQIIFQKKQYFVTCKNFYDYMKYIKKLGAYANSNSLKSVIINEDLYNQEIVLNYNVFFCILKI